MSQAHQASKGKGEGRVSKYTYVIQTLKNIMKKNEIYSSASWKVYTKAEKDAMNDEITSAIKLLKESKNDGEK